MLGGGQLGRMMALAAAQLGYKMHVFCPEDNNPMEQVCDKATHAYYEDKEALRKFARAVDVVTYEFENIPVETVNEISKYTPVFPGSRVLEISQDRLTEKTFINDLGIETAPFRGVTNVDEVKQALQEISYPAVLKTRRFGYDGKGQVKINDRSEASAAFDAIAGAPAILEGFIPFEKEVSVIAARAIDGTSAAYDVGENVHRDHILHTTTVPAVLDASVAEEARTIAERIAHGLDYVGDNGVEFFVHIEGDKRTLCVNEFAPRVHNSGHWTSDACMVSQFEQHIRAIVGWPLGNPARHSDAVMTNLIGAEAGEWMVHASLPHSAVHLYGKRDARPGRKMGHVTKLNHGFTKTD